MTNDPETIRQDIEETRSSLSYDVDALADKVSPSSIAQRQTEKVKGVARKVKDSVMGAADGASSHVGDAASSIGDVPHSVVDKAKGSPVAVGLIAFGVGLLAAALIPASQKEKELAQTAKDKAAPLVDDLKETAQGIAEDLKEPAKEAAESVKGAAADAVSNVKEDAASTAKDVTGEAEGNPGPSAAPPTPPTTGYVAPDSGASPLGTDQFGTGGFGADEPVFDATRTEEPLR